MPPESAQGGSSQQSSVLTTGDSSSTPASPAPLPGSSPGCWAANLSASIGLGFTVWKLGIPLCATCLDALKAGDLSTFVVSFVAVLMIARSSGPNDVVKLIGAAKDLPAAWIQRK